MISSVVSLACLKIPNGIFAKLLFYIEIVFRLLYRHVAATCTAQYAANYKSRNKSETKRRDIDDTQSGEVAYEISSLSRGSRGYKGIRTFNDDILTKSRPTRATAPLLSNLVREVRIS